MDNARRLKTYTDRHKLLRIHANHRRDRKQEGGKEKRPVIGVQGRAALTLNVTESGANIPSEMLV
jgi:hypothetical protein